VAGMIVRVGSGYRPQIKGGLAGIFLVGPVILTGTDLLLGSGW